MIFGKIRKYALLAVLLLLISAFGGCTEPVPDKAVLHETDNEYISYAPVALEIEMQSPQGFIYDVNTRQIVFSKGKDHVIYPASTTKLLTALCALEILSPDDIVTPKDELSLVKPGSSVAYIKEHHSLSVEMLVEAMIIPSGNDAAYVLAAACGRKLKDDPELDGTSAVSEFMKYMNKYALSIGLCGTYFTVPDGYAGEEHYSTIEDMAIVSLLASKNEIISKYAAKEEDSVVYASGHSNNWKNTNALLYSNGKYYNEYVTGLKTGSGDFGYNLVCSVGKNGQSYIIGVFGAEKETTRYEDVINAINILIDSD